MCPNQQVHAGPRYIVMTDLPINTDCFILLICCWDGASAPHFWDCLHAVVSGISRRRLGPLAESGLGRLREKLVLPGPISVRVSLRAGSVTWVFRPRSLGHLDAW